MWVQGKDNRKIQFAILCCAAVRGGLKPDLLDEVSWWKPDDFWRYSLLAAVALIRACAERQGVSVPELASRLADHLGVDVEQTSTQRTRSGQGPSPSGEPG